MPRVEEESPAREALLRKVVSWCAEHGIGDTSLRALATGVGTSHRMLLYHFGSREGLLSAVVQAIERDERALLAGLLDEHADPYDAATAFWPHVADRAATFAPLYFELAGLAMQGHDWAEPLRRWLLTGWDEVLTDVYTAAGHSTEEARLLGGLGLATARGLLFALALGGDRAQADRAMLGLTEILRERSGR
jgi:AcrR family transcriptional regulator